MGKRTKLARERFVDFGDNALERVALFRLRLQAVRSGVWFRALSRIDRALLDLTLKVSAEVRSRKLVKALFAVVSRLQIALGSSVSHVVLSFGFRSARKLSLVAQRLGNVSARGWATDFSFARFLAVMYLNGSDGKKR